MIGNFGNSPRQTEFIVIRLFKFNHILQQGYLLAQFNFGNIVFLEWTDQTFFGINTLVDLLYFSFW